MIIYMGGRSSLRTAALQVFKLTHDPILGNSLPTFTG
jgi:hypothetical protein